MVLKVIGGVIALFAVIFALEFFSLVNYEFFGVKWEDAKRNVYEETKSYNDGTARDLQNLVLEYHKAGGPHQEILRQTIRHRAADYDLERLPAHVRVEVEKIIR